MKKQWMLLALFLVAPVHAQELKSAAKVATPADADLNTTVDKVLACMNANAPASVRIQQIELDSTDRGGTRTIKGALYLNSEKTTAGKRLRVLLKLTEPADLAGAAYLVRQAEDYLKDGMYVYLPSVRRVRRVSGTFADGSLLGTNFSYNDFKQMELAFVNADSLLEDSEMVENRKAYVMSFSPSKDETDRYSVVRVYVDQATCVPVKAEFRAGMDVVKEMTVPFSALQRTPNGHWMVNEVHMRDLIQNSSSVLKVTGTAVDAVIPATSFDPESFYLGR